MSGNGAGPKVTDLSATLLELAEVGRALELTPAELAAKTKQGRDTWATVELGQAFAWVIARRERPALTWEEARTFALDVVGSPPDPPKRAAVRASRRAGTASPSSATG